MLPGVEAFGDAFDVFGGGRGDEEAEEPGLSPPTLDSRLTAALELEFSSLCDGVSKGGISVGGSIRREDDN